MPEKFYKIDTSGKFHETFFGIIYSAKSILPNILTQVTLLVALLIMPKKVLWNWHLGSVLYNLLQLKFTFQVLHSRVGPWPYLQTLD